MSRASSPEEGRAVLAMMRDALVEARLGVSRVRDALNETQALLARERAELETVRRRGRLAAEIDDAETVAVAERFERRHIERIAVFERKVAAQEAEVALAQSELDEMNAQFRSMKANGGAAAPAAPPADDEGEDGPDSDTLRRAMERAERETAAERQLSELKRRMGR